jgi:hypothetical protein
MGEEEALGRIDDFAPSLFLFSLSSIGDSHSSTPTNPT